MKLGSGSLWSQESGERGVVWVNPVRVQLDKLAAAFEAQISEAWCVETPGG